MNWSSFDTWIVIAGVLCAASCALPGTFLVLRRMSMMGDAISHAVLPGLAISFLITGSRSSWPMFLSAVATGVLTAMFTQWVSKFGRVDKGASMGIVFTTLFALGLVLIVRFSDHVDLDPGCVLYGALEYVPLDTMNVFGLEVPRAVLVIGAVFLINLSLIFFLFKEFRLTAFDSQIADSLGFKSSLMHYLLMIMVAVTTVSCFELVGSIIVIAMLIVPAATALLVTRDLKVALALALVFGALSAVFGHLTSVLLPEVSHFSSPNTSGMIATMSGVLFTFVLVFTKFRRKFVKM